MTKTSALFRVCLGDEILLRYIGIIVNHCKDPYKPTSIMESKRVFFFVAQVVFTRFFLGCWKNAGKHPC